jgi:hypothetical protein
VVIGFEIPPGMRKVARSMARNSPWVATDDFQVFRASGDELVALRAQSHTANMLLSLVGAQAECFVIDQLRLMRGTCRFVAFTYCAARTSELLANATFWRGALAPLVADSMRTFELSQVPGQRSRFRERRRTAEAAAFTSLSMGASPLG